MSSVVEKALALRSLPAPPERRAIRERARVSQDDIGADIGVTRAAVARWEAGTRRPRGEHLVRYAELLDQLREVAS